VDTKIYNTQIAQVLTIQLLKDEKPQVNDGLERYFQVNVASLSYGCLLVDNKSENVCNLTIEYNLTGLDIF